MAARLHRRTVLVEGVDDETLLKLLKTTDTRLTEQISREHCMVAQTEGWILLPVQDSLEKLPAQVEFCVLPPSESSASVVVDRLG
jgi:hypothetical protein